MRKLLAVSALGLASLLPMAASAHSRVLYYPAPVLYSSHWKHVDFRRHDHRWHDARWHRFDRHDFSRGRFDRHDHDRFDRRDFDRHDHDWRR